VASWRYEGIIHPDWISKEPIYPGGGPTPSRSAALGFADAGDHSYYVVILVKSAATAMGDWDEDLHPRADDGKFTSGLGGPDTHGKSPIDNSDKRDQKYDPDDVDKRYAQMQSARQEIATALGHVGIDNVQVADMPTTVRTAHVAANVLKEMKDKGYRLPDSVNIEGDSGDDGETVPSGVTVSDNPKYGTSNQALTIKIPTALPPDADLDRAVAVAYGGKIPGTKIDKYSAHNMRDVVIHEMGHVQHGFISYPQAVIHDAQVAFKATGDTEDQVIDKILSAARSVSGYAEHHPQEFVAEAFTRMYRGEKLTPEAMKLYKAMKGPAIQ
jgi:hypothetical protein